MQEDYKVVETNFRKQSFPEYYLTLHGLADALDGNEVYNAEKPKWLADGALFRQHVVTMKELGVAAERGDSLLKDQRQSVRDQSELDVDAVVSYVRALALNRRTPALLHTLGLPLKEPQQKSSRRNSPQQTLEIHLDVRHMKDETGAIAVLGGHVRSGGPYQINLCKGEPVSEASWYNPGGHYKSCRRVILRNLEPANRYYIRMRTDGPEGPGPWSHPVSIIVL